MSPAVAGLDVKPLVGEASGGELHIEYEREYLDGSLAKLTPVGDVFSMSHEEAAAERAGLTGVYIAARPVSAPLNCAYCWRVIGQEYGPSVVAPRYCHSAAGCYPASPYEGVRD